jgi:hypothetical protein
VIKRITDYTVNTQAGRDNVPHLCVKAQHNNGFAWFGVSLITFQSRPWTPDETKQVRDRLIEAMHRMCDILEFTTDLSRLMDSIRDIVVGRKRPTIFGGGVNEFMQMYLPNNIQFDVFRTEINPNTLTYGGFKVQVNVRDTELFGFLYHRGVILTNYISDADAIEITEAALRDAFPEMFADVAPTEADATIHVSVLEVVERNRNKNRSDEVNKCLPAGDAPCLLN